ncbi:phage BR0599 family protein [Phocoenobacter skyensis]|uniref:Phage BR0599 family protein n=1 Tax=Phocoenobacter skyensis TaxID=97481 RepID=A0ABT9JKP1_9PAST|nr:phage BR0599 family protein [Pasteurella skyensis]MDP8079511.1 phage BR0599 family protein [Pasteurella skyensis]MDP8085383.1 phage BR0599 family protein [Pasteurella skyensis]
MSYLDKTLSIAGAQPITLYQFIRGDNEKIWRFCDADKTIEVNNEKWISTAISDSGRRTGENINITLPSNNPVAQLYRGIAPSQTVRVMIMRLHYKEQEIRVVWVGNIIEAKRPESHKTELISAGLSTTMESSGLRLSWGRNCPYSLYDYDCKVNPKNFVLTGLEIKAINGTTITLNVPNDIPENWFNAGFIEWIDNDGVREVRAVTLHKNNELTLMGGTQKLSIGTIIKVYPGCDGNVKTCKNKFNNILNFGGIPHMPNKSPYDGSRVF